jgi:hypothetical protein
MKTSTWILFFNSITQCLPALLQRYIESLPVNTIFENFHLNSSQDCPVLASTGINNSMAITAGQTQSERLFSISTDIDSCSLTFQNSDKFYLVMEMQAEFQ